jgi:hypothetical protein
MGGFLFDCFFKNKWSLLKFLYLTRHYFKCLAAILTDGAIFFLTDCNLFSGEFWLAATYSAASFDLLLYYIAALFDSPLLYLYIIMGDIWLATAYSLANFDLLLC